MILEHGVTVIICCYNSVWIIERTLNALKLQRIADGLAWEIVLVDNNCSDDTVLIAKRTMQGCNVSFKIVTEKKPGLANARKCGIANAKYDVVVYCDDDNLLCPDYVNTMYDIMCSDNHIGAAGGMGIAEYQAEPAEIVRSNPGHYAVGSQMNNEYSLFGAGLTLRTNLVKEVYDHQRLYLIGRKGKKLLSGDDSELVMSMVVRGYCIKPTDAVYYTHVLKANRLTAEYYEQLHLGLEIPRPVLEVFHAVIVGDSFKTILHHYYIIIKTIIWSIVKFYRPDALRIRKENLRWFKYYNSWGLFRLWMIYIEWSKIKKNTALSSRMS